MITNGSNGLPDKPLHRRRCKTLLAVAFATVFLASAFLASAFSVAAGPRSVENHEAVNPGIFHLARAETMAGTTTVFCTYTGRVDGDAGRIACAELLAQLQAEHPGHGFIAGKPARGSASLEVRIGVATDHNFSLNLILTSANGDKQETENFSVSAMDRKLTPQLRNNVFRRAIAEILSAG